MKQEAFKPFRRSRGRRDVWIRLVLLVLLTIMAPTAFSQQPPGAARPRIHGPLTVEQAVTAGLQYNLELKAAQAGVRAARAEKEAARSATRPQVSANTYLTTGDMPNVMPVSPGAMPPNYNLTPSKGNADQNLTLMVPLYTGGRLGNLVRAAARREDAASAEEQGARADVVLRVREAYYRALLAKEMVKAAQARLDADTAMLQTVRSQFEAGKGIEASVRRVEAEQADAQRILTSTQADEAKALLDLKTAMGVNLDSDIVLSDELAFTPPSDTLNAQLEEAGRSRPEVQAARFRTAAARAQTNAAKGSLQPQIYATAMADVFQPYRMRGGTGYTVGLTVSLPVLDGGQRRAEIAGARAMQQHTEAQLSDLELQVENEVRQAWLDVETAAQNYRTAQAALQAAQAAYDVTALRVQNQKGILVEQ